MKQDLGISIIGLGKLGLCMAACFADKGFKVIGVDVDMEKVNKINKGISPIPETNLQEVLKKAKNNLRATTDYEYAISHTTVSFIVVATPSLADGSFSNEYVEKALHNIGEVLKKGKSYHLVVIASTVMPETTEKVAKFILEKVTHKKCGKEFGLVYNPEFIAMGSILHDFLNPDMLLIGEMNTRDGDALKEIYKKTCENTPYFTRMSPVNAEITKIALNCYITTKITFANSIAALCEKVKGADANVITGALGMDTRIGGKYIKPGLGYGGPCLPRDNIALAAYACKLETRVKLAEMVDEVNQDQVLRVVNRINEIVFSVQTHKNLIKIGVLGLSYKPNTPIIEDSQALGIVQLLVNEGYRVKVYDPQAIRNVLSVLGNTVTYTKNSEECLAGVDLALVAVPWSEFEKINFKKLNKKIVILDCWGLLRKRKGVDIRYLGVGVNMEEYA